jgi:tetratricopeptide (TPR) repeat protein
MTGQPSPPEVPVGAGGWEQRWQVPAICLVLAAITFAVFGQTAGFEFVNFDDNVYVYENAKVTGGLNMKSLAWVFTHADCTFYHPLTMLSLMADYQLHGLHAGGYHLTNVLLHTASVILLFLVLRQMTGALWRSAFVAAVFAIHPLRVESVAWVTERKDVLSGFFFMLTLGAYVLHVRKPDSPARSLVVAAAFVLALLSKSSVVTLPFVLLLLDYWPLRRFEQSRKLSGLILEKIPLLALAAAACATTVLVAGKLVTPEVHFSMPLRLGNALVYYATYLRQMVWPEGLAVAYPDPHHGLPPWEMALGGALLAGVSAVAWAERRRRPWLLVGWLWYLGMLTPMIGIVPVGAFAQADRFTYLPQIGIYLAVTWLVAEWRVSRVALGGLMAAVLAVLMVCAWKQTAYWKNSETLWTHTLACTADNSLACSNLGGDLLTKGRVDEAIAYLQKALQIKPDYMEAHYNLGNAFLQKGNVDEAITQYREALKINPALAKAHLRLGNALLQKGNVDEAMVHLQRAAQIAPHDAAIQNKLGYALLQMGKVNEAITHFEQALQTKPDFAEAHNNLGNALGEQGRLDEAIAHFEQAAVIDPGFVAAQYNLGIAYCQKGRGGDAIPHFQQALQIEPAEPRVQNNLAWLLAVCSDASLRNGAKAVELARQANALTGGENPAILHTLAAAFAEAGRFPEAMETAQRALRLAGAQSNKGLAGALQSEMKLYKAGLPLHH